MNRKTMITALALSTALVMPTAVMPAFAEAATEGEAAAADIASMKWSDFAVSLDGEVFDFPMTYAEFETKGWTPSDDISSETIAPNQYSWVYYEKDGHTLIFYLLNLDVNTIPLNQALVCGIDMDSYYWDVSEGEVILPGGLVRGTATQADVEAAYGTPSDVYEGDNYTKLTYETDVYESIEVQIDKETGTISDFDIRDLEAPEDFETGAVSTEVPAAVAAYQKPAELSTDTSAYEVRVEDNVYTLPVPVSTLIADGWELKADDSAAYIKGGYFDWVTLQNGGQKIHAIAQNPEADAVAPENGWIEELEFGPNDINLDAELPGGLKVGMPREDFLEWAKANGITCETEASGDFEYYKYNQGDSYDQYIQVVVYTGDNGVYESNTVLQFEISNPVE